MRQEKVYKISLDKECTFKPRMITQESKLSKSIISGGAGHF